MNLKLKVISGGGTVTEEDLNRINKGLWKEGYTSLFRYVGTWQDPSKPIKLLEWELQRDLK